MPIEQVIRLYFLLVNEIPREKEPKSSPTFVSFLVLSLTGFLLLEQILITDGTAAPLNRLRIIYAFAAAIALIVFGISAAIVASNWHSSYYQSHYHSRKRIFRLLRKQSQMNCP